MDKLRCRSACLLTSLLLVFAALPQKGVPRAAHGDTQGNIVGTKSPDAPFHPAAAAPSHSHPSCSLPLSLLCCSTHCQPSPPLLQPSPPPSTFTLSAPTLTPATPSHSRLCCFLPTLASASPPLLHSLLTPSLNPPHLVSVVVDELSLGPDVRHKVVSCCLPQVL